MKDAGTASTERAAACTEAEVCAIDTPSAAAFRQRFFDSAEPVILRGFLAAWPAASTWSPESFAARFPSAKVTVMSAATDFAREGTAYRAAETLAMAEYARLVQSTRGPERPYLVAQSQLLRQPEFSALWQDMAFDPEWFDREGALTGVSLWMGPPGTVTPLHHDLQPALLAQVYGRKRVTLAAPADGRWLHPVWGGYAAVDLEQPDLAAHPLAAHAARLSAVLEPGDALFLPCNYWHQVRSLSASISLSLANFAWPH